MNLKAARELARNIVVTHKAGYQRSTLADLVLKATGCPILYNCQTHHAEPDWALFDALEIDGCADHDGVTEGGVPDGFADFWCVFGHLKDGGREAITDCKTWVSAQHVAGVLSLISKLPVR